jgi:hypothetical protein
MKQVIMLIVTTEVLGISVEEEILGTPITRAFLGSHRTPGSLAGPPGSIARMLGCSASATALVVLTGPIRFGPRCFRFDQNLENEGLQLTVSR